LPFTDDRVYGAIDSASCFADLASYLSFIGAVVIRRDLWLKRSDGKYFDTLFSHVGVIFGQPPLFNVKVLSSPLIVIRYGNAMWSQRGFEIWMFKWPRLIWSFPDFRPEQKLAVTPRRPWRSFKRLVLYRGTGGYSRNEYEKFLLRRATGLQGLLCKLVALMPGTVANWIAAWYCYLVRKQSRGVIYDLGRSKYSTSVTRCLARARLRSEPDEG
jgi:hypothetical protein